MKAVLVIDAPENCIDCVMRNGADECILQDEDTNFAADSWEDLRKGCPLVPMPKKVTEPIDSEDVGKDYSEGTMDGWNACLDAIGSNLPAS